MTWRTAKCLDTLLHQVDAAYPGRDKSSDGTIGDSAHAATKSEHNPDENGVVRARDISHDPAHGLDARKLAEALIASRDNRILYVISNAQICSSVVSPWTWRAYNGVNAHRHHMHLSVVENPALYDDERPWSIDGAVAKPPPPPLNVKIDQRALDAILTAASSSELRHHSWSGRGPAPIGYIKGVAVTYAIALQKLAARDPTALAMVRTVNGAHDVFDHYEQITVAAGMGTLGASEVDRLRTLWVILTGLGMRESSGGNDIGQDSSAPGNKTAEEAEAGTWQQSWNSRSASPEIQRLFDASKDELPTNIDAIFREGTNPRAGENYGDGDGREFQELCKTRPSIAAQFAAIGMRTLSTHWGPLNNHAVEVVPAADALFRQVEAIVGVVPVVVPTPQRPDPMPDPVQPTQPAKPAITPPTTIPVAPAVLSTSIDIGRILQFVADHEADAHRVLTIAVTLHNQLHPDRKVALQGDGQTLPAIDPVSQRPSVIAGVLGMIVSAVAAHPKVGAIGMDTGVLSGILSLGTAALGATGGWGKLASVGLNVLGALARASTQQK